MTAKAEMFASGLCRFYWKYGENARLLCQAWLSLVFQGRRFEWPFLLARVQFPIIGVDFLRHFKLLVDPAVSRLVDTVSTQLLPTVSSVRSQLQPTETSTMAAATPAHRYHLTASPVAGRQMIR